MNGGRIKITKQYLLKYLGFPRNWIIGDVSNYNEDTIEIDILGPEFPIIKNNELKDCKLTIHTTDDKFEVEEI
jgi:hypothetical protein